MRRIALCALIGLAAVACSSNSGSNSQTRPQSTAKLAILQPTSGQTVDGKDVEVKLQLTGGTITKVTTKNIKPNIGHIHLRLDGATITLLGSLDDHIRNVDAGQHILQAEFVAADHGPFDPDILSTVTFTAK